MLRTAVIALDRFNPLAVAISVKMATLALTVMTVGARCHGGGNVPACESLRPVGMR
jgi:hypothetical protein